jgi:hypothetical protein
MGRALIVAFFILISGGGVCAMSQETPKSDRELASLVPREVQGWKSEGEDAVYDPDTIYGYIDGAGEVYRAYNFKRLLARRFVREAMPALIVDFFDMGTSADAFGVFTHDLMGKDAGIGQASTYKGGLLSFWKSHFFVSVYAEEENPETKAAVLKLGRSIDSSIMRTGRKPVLLNFLPDKNLDKKDIHYFHTHLILNYHFFVAEQNVLNLNAQTEAVLAAYGQKPDRGHLLLIRYRDVEKAQEAYYDFTRSYMPDLTEPGLAQTEDKKWTAAVISRNMIVIFFGASSREAAREMMVTVDKNITAKTSWGLIVGKDPVAVDATGVRILQAKRLKYFGEDKPLQPSPLHIALAETRHHLGRSGAGQIELIKLGWQEDILI